MDETKLAAITAAAQRYHAACKARHESWRAHKTAADEARLLEERAVADGRKVEVAERELLDLIRGEG